MRRILAPILSCLLASNVSANPLALVLANHESAPEISDQAAASVHEAAGEPEAAGELDAADLSKLSGRLASIPKEMHPVPNSLRSDITPFRCVKTKSETDGNNLKNADSKDSGSAGDSLDPSSDTTANPSPRPTNLPAGAVENPDRPGSWGEYDKNGEFVEKWRIDRGTPGKPGWRGKDHVHVNGEKEHLPPDTQYPEGKP